MSDDNGVNERDANFWNKLCTEFGCDTEPFQLWQIEAKLGVPQDEAKAAISRIIYANKTWDDDWDELRITEDGYLFPGIRR